MIEIGFEGLNYDTMPPLLIYQIEVCYVSPPGLAISTDLKTDA
jgi:hypothetical protein